MKIDKDLIKEVTEIFSNPGPDGHTHYSQRLGQKLVNYVRFVAIPEKYPKHARMKNGGLYHTCSEQEYNAMIEHYLFNMSDDEFMKALQSC